MLKDRNAPIGIFDSGIGGLTVAKAIMNKLPHENLIYFGDTAHLPYGDKSAVAIQSYSIKICNLLLEKNAKIIVIACNSASAAAYDLVKTYVGSKAEVVNVIDPAVKYISQNFAEKKVGIIGTKQTIGSGIYKRKIDEHNKGIEVHSLATPLLAPMIEEGFFNNNISHQIIEEYLSNPTLEGIEALVLGCTHYPLIKKEIEQHFQAGFQVLDSSSLVANEVFNLLNASNLINSSFVEPSSDFFVSDYTQAFESATQTFFGEKVSLVHYPIWD